MRRAQTGKYVAHHLNQIHRTKCIIGWRVYWHAKFLLIPWICGAHFRYTCVTENSFQWNLCLLSSYSHLNGMFLYQCLSLYSRNLRFNSEKYIWMVLYSEDIWFGISVKCAQSLHSTPYFQQMVRMCFWRTSYFHYLFVYLYFVLRLWKNSCILRPAFEHIVHGFIIRQSTLFVLNLNQMQKSSGQIKWLIKTTFVVIIHIYKIFNVLADMFYSWCDDIEADLVANIRSIIRIYTLTEEPKT